MSSQPSKFCAGSVPASIQFNRGERGILDFPIEDRPEKTSKMLGMLSTDTASNLFEKDCLGVCPTSLNINKAHYKKGARGGTRLYQGIVVDER